MSRPRAPPGQGRGHPRVPPGSVSEQEPGVGAGVASGGVAPVGSGARAAGAKGWCQKMGNGAKSPKLPAWGVLGWARQSFPLLLLHGCRGPCWSPASPLLLEIAVSPPAALIRLLVFRLVGHLFRLFGARAFLSYRGEGEGHRFRAQLRERVPALCPAALSSPHPSPGACVPAETDPEQVQRADPLTSNALG